MEILFIVLILVAVLTILFLPALLLARRGIGSRRIWLGGGIGGLLGLILYIAVWSMPSRPSEPTNSVTFDPVSVYHGPSPLGVDGAEASCILVAFSFMLAALFYKPKKRTDVSLLSNSEGSIPHAGRSK